jgi:hypothetical protein
MKPVKNRSSKPSKPNTGKPVKGGKPNIRVPFVWKNAPSEDEVKSGSKLLKIGMKGDFVKKLQSELNKAAEQDGNPNYNVGKVDGFFGRKTKRGLQNFQTSAGLNPDGIMGTQTYKTLFRETPEKIDLQTKKVKDVEPEISKAEVQPQSSISSIKDVKLDTPKGGVRRQSTITSVKENDMNNKPTIKESLKKNLKQTLNEKRRLEENLIIETKIVTNRYSLIGNGLVLETEEQQMKFVESLIAETQYLKSQGYSSEIINEGLFNFLGSLFTGSFSAVPAVIGEYIASWLLKTLGVEQNSYIGGVIIALVGNLNISDYDKFFTDCRFASNKIADSLIEGYVIKLQNDQSLNQGAGGFVLSALRNSVVDYFVEDKTGLVEKLEEQLADFICPKLSKLSGKMGDMMSSIKDKAVA